MVFEPYDVNKAVWEMVPRAGATESGDRVSNM
jgi:hypothetical protein